MSRELGLAHLSALHLSPPELVEAAAAAGFGFVGVRVFPATENETRYPMAPGSPLSRRTRAALDATGLRVIDVEAFALDGRHGREDWLPALEAGAALGATVLNVIGDDPDPVRLGENLAALVEDGREHGIRPSLEPISYKRVDSVGAALALVERTGCAIMVDVLHLMRAGGSVADLTSLPDGVVPVIQLCDGPATTPALPDPPSLPLGQTPNPDPRVLESRTKRLAPGDGVFPLRDMLAAVPAAGVSVEVPDLRAVAETGVEAHLARIHAAAAGVVSDLVTEPKASNTHA